MTEYKRHGGKSYMVLRAETAAEGYEYLMLTKNRIAGFLPAQIANDDGQMQFWYEISGRQALEDRIRTKKPGSGFLKKVIAALALAIRQSGEYLLDESGISLEPERIFIDAGEKEILFCYMPFAKMPLTESLRKFMEYYISQMEHGNRESAQKCYDVYEKCQQDHVSMEELLRILYESGEEQDAREDAREEAWQEQKEEQVVLKEEPLQTSERKRQSWRSNLDIWKGRLGIRSKKRDLPGQYAFEPEEYQRELSSPTVFLGSETGQTIGELRYEGDGNAPNLAITSPVFLIGSRKKEADGVIFDDTVSRIHAKITKEKDGYYLEDMNSTNGTYYNGELLNYKEKVLLAKNDSISFAKERYRFV